VFFFVFLHRDISRAPDVMQRKQAVLLIVQMEHDDHYVQLCGLNKVLKQIISVFFLFIFFNDLAI